MSENKSYFIIFNTRKDFDRRISLTISIDSAVLSFREKVKYLGVVLNFRELWKEHLIYIKNKENKFFNLFKWIAGSFWEVHSLICVRLLVVLYLTKDPLFWSMELDHTLLLLMGFFTAYKIALGLPKTF